MKAVRGFTIIELMVTLVIVAVMVTLAAPSFTRMIRQNRMSTQVNEFIAAANLAKSEAIRRSGPVKIQSDPGSAATAVFSANGFAVTSSGTVLRVFAKFTGATTLTHVTGTGPYTVATGTGLDYVQFNSRGGVDNSSTPVQFKACDTTDNAIGARLIKINAVGQISISTITSTSCP